MCCTSQKQRLRDEKSKLKPTFCRCCFNSPHSLLFSYNCFLIDPRCLQSDQRPPSPPTLPRASSPSLSSFPQLSLTSLRLPPPSPLLQGPRRCCPRPKARQVRP
jgi:hypothetical protein